VGLKPSLGAPGLPGPGENLPRPGIGPLGPGPREGGAGNGDPPLPLSATDWLGARLNVLRLPGSGGLVGAGESVCTGLDAPLASPVVPLLPFSGTIGDFGSPGRGGNGANSMLDHNYGNHVSLTPLARCAWWTSQLLHTPALGTVR
jgi:hypothetical protein